jgi:glutathione peroxidase
MAAKGLLQALRGKVTLVVNVASRCGYTPQYADLGKPVSGARGAEFHGARYSPAINSAAQEPGTPAEIQQFCSVNYGVSFPLAAKIDVNGAHRHPLYTWLTDARKRLSGRHRLELREIPDRRQRRDRRALSVGNEAARRGFAAGSCQADLIRAGSPGDQRIAVRNSEIVSKVASRLVRFRKPRPSSPATRYHAVVPWLRNR